MLPETPPDTHQKSKRHWPSVLIIGIAVLVVLGTGTILAVKFFAKPHITVPDTIIKNTKTVLYVPTKLPGNYTIDSQSFMIAEEGVVIFRANDGAGGQIVFSEQTTPKNVNFDDFYKEQFQETKTLNNVPFPSVFGKGGQGQLLLSVVAKDTWMIATTQSPLTESDFQQIAQSMQKYEP